LFAVTVTFAPWLPLVGLAVSQVALLVTDQVSVPEPIFAIVRFCDAGDVPTVDAKVSDVGRIWREGDWLVEKLYDAPFAKPGTSRSEPSVSP
jgi:hypothetical protein